MELGRDGIDAEAELDLDKAGFLEDVAESDKGDFWDDGMLYWRCVCWVFILISGLFG